MNKYRLEYYSLIIIGKVLNLLSKISINFSSALLATIFYHLLGIRKKIVHKNLRIAFPNLSESAVKKLAFENYKSLAVTLIEIFSVEKMSKDQIKDRFSTEGFEIIYDKLKIGKGLILLTGHFGNWELAAI
ncbi:MAG: hypothetical protein R3250_09940, partial [Melioribacteraceae bacterium]|nr:hypothetical protein [Melioribacteraceae bacterium]